jgi:alpha-1,3-rhamnosyl/mannosyltransferase
MKVLIDVSPLRGISPELGPTGVGRWIEGAIEALGTVAPEWELHLLDTEPNDADDGLPSRPNHVRHNVSVPAAVRRVRGSWTSPRIAGELPGIDAVLGTTFVPWRLPGARSIPVIYDLSYIHAADTGRVGQMLFLRASMRSVVKRASAVVTISEAVKSEIVAHYGVSERDVFVAYPGIAAQPSVVAPVDLDLPSEYLLFVGTIEPRKNLALLLGTIASLRSDGVAVPPLVVAGGRGWRSSRDETLLARSERDHGTRVLGYVARSALPSLYRGASMLVFPSLYEGFGLPPLEAMFYGCPVVASNHPVIAEVVGDAGMLVSPEDRSALGQAIVQILTDRNRRANFIERGYRRAAFFTWERCGETLMAAVEHHSHDHPPKIER